MPGRVRRVRGRRHHQACHGAAGVGEKQLLLRRCPPRDAHAIRRGHVRGVAEVRLLNINILVMINIDILTNINNLV